jgi:leucyl-tRNA synthetase
MLKLAADLPSYDQAAIEQRWQAAWREAELYLTPSSSDSAGDPAYIFARFPALSEDAPLELIRTYAIADSYARFMRARGAPVLLASGFDAFGPEIEREAIQSETTPAAWVQSAVARISRQFRRLGFSLDFSRVRCSSDPDVYRFSQQLFLILLEKGLIYHNENGWYLRFGAFLQENAERLSRLDGWNDVALASQRSIPGSVDGVEFDVASVDGTPLTVFTAHAQAREQAEFIAMSPNHPEIERWIPASQLHSQMDEADQAGGIVETDRLVSGVGTDSPLPVIVSAEVDRRFGATAVLGIPAVEPADAVLAKQIKPPGTTAWRITDKGPSSVRPAQRYSAHDILLSHQRAWGTPIPTIDCEVCGQIAVAIEALPVRLPDDLQVRGGESSLADDEGFLHCPCPQCDAPARRETATLDPHFDGLWQWMAPCVDLVAGAKLFEDPELERWLPVKRAVRGAGDGGLMFDQRTTAKALRDCGLLAQLSDDEPFTGVTMHERVERANPKERIHLDGLLKRTGADAVRLAILFAAAPENVLPWKAHTLHYCHRWLSSLWSYAMPRLQKLEELPEIDASQGAVALRGRLGRWSRIAVERVTENYEEVQMHRAVRNVMVLTVRIEDYEQRVIERYGELTPADSSALADALITAVQLIAPVTPHIAEELWAAAGRDGFVAAAGWPEIEAQL